MRKELDSVSEDLSGLQKLKSEVMNGITMLNGKISGEEGLLPSSDMIEDFEEFQDRVRHEVAIHGNKGNQGGLSRNMGVSASSANIRVKMDEYETRGRDSRSPSPD
jgi:hypothetical protein